jgi:polyphosphate glucokinase
VRSAGVVTGPILHDRVAAHRPITTLSPVQGFGVDIGGSGIKGCLVDLETGTLAGERLRIETPQPSHPDAVFEIVARIVEHFGWTGRIGVTFPGVLKQGVAHTAANVDKSWIGTDVDAGLSEVIPGSVHTLNDADAAGLAEMRFGAGRHTRGVVLMLTFGTGIGSALFTNGHLVPNTEFGHIQVDGEDGERRASAAAREREGLDYPTWARRVDRYLDVLEAGLWPDLIIAGGGVSKKAEKWVPLLSTRTPVVPAVLQNDAGIVGAALAAVENPD